MKPPLKLSRTTYIALELAQGSALFGTIPAHTSMPNFNNLGGTVKQFRRLACVLIVSGSEALRKKDNSFKAQTALKLNRAR